MKEELKDYIFKKSKHLISLEDFEIIDQLIDKFFEQYQPERLSPEDAIIPAYYGSKFCGGCKEENCVCDSPTPDNKENQGITQK